MSALLMKSVVHASQTTGNNADLRELSHREVQILPYLVAGEPNKVIARRLQVTEATVKVHMKSLMRKIGTANRTQAAIWALNHGISDDPDEVVADFDSADAPPPPQWRDVGRVR
jgi:DNA-binding NarL/FixJ family response regulator